MKKVALYRTVIIASIGAMLWLGWNLKYYHPDDPKSGINACMFRRVTGIPCPSCGSTRSLLYLAKLDFKDALHSNPIGFILAFALLVFPIWVVYDMVKQKSSFYTFYRNTEFFVRKRWVAISLICLVAANWFWNIYKFYS